MVGTSASLPVARKAVVALRSGSSCSIICMDVTAPVNLASWSGACGQALGRTYQHPDGKRIASTVSPHRIVFANEKGGTGKSTTAVHIAIALAYQGAKVAAIDLDPRQRTLHRYLENRSETERRRGISLPGVRYAVFNGDSIESLDSLSASMGEGMDFLLFDTPGRDDEFARHAATEADTLVTPLNDSFVDFDLIGQVDAETFKVRKLSFYAELIWEARKKRAMATIREARREMDWVVVRNRTGYTEARNVRRLDSALTELSKRVGFRISSGLSERVIYRELFPSGLTLLDKGHLGELGTSHLVARQELRSLLNSLNLPAHAQTRTELLLTEQV
jgi:chromosome partitioning protein